MVSREVLNDGFNSHCSENIEVYVVLPNTHPPFTANTMSSSDVTSENAYILIKNFSLVIPLHLYFLTKNFETCILYI